MLAESQGATIADAWVASITMALGRSSHRLTIKLSNNDNVWNILGEHFGQNNPVAMAGEMMPPKSTYFYPKVPSGMLFARFCDAF